MSRNLLRKTKRENVRTLLYQTLNFARVVEDTDPYTDTETAIVLVSVIFFEQHTATAVDSGQRTVISGR